MDEALHTKISVITPLYKGKRYLEFLREILIENSKRLNSECFLEWIIVNDYPEEVINESDYKTEINTIYVTHEKNEGIHKSRIDGILRSSGQYIVLLDQDDRIANDYLCKQLNLIANNDAVVCDAEQDGQSWFERINIKEFEYAISLEKMLKHGNQILSPGQVMIKRSSIPDMWYKSVLKNNGSDDYYLWVCMLVSNCSLVINREILLYHIITGRNASMNSIEMRKSSNEAIGHILNYGILDERQTKAIIEYQKEQNDNLCKVLAKCKTISDVLEKMMTINNGQNVFLQNLGKYRKENVAIYGYGTIGKIVCMYLKQNGFKNICVIDRNKDNIELLDHEMALCCPEEVPEMNISCVIITVIYDMELVKKRLNSQCPEMKIYYLQDLLW